MSKAKYVANNLITGLVKADLQTGDKVELEMEVAGPFVAGGSLSLVEAPPAPPAGGDKEKGEPGKK